MHSNLTYFWRVVSAPAGASNLTFSLSGTNAAENPKIRRDLNADGIINAQDILAVINFIISNPMGGSSGKGEDRMGPVPQSRIVSPAAAEVPESLLAVLAADIAHGRRRKSP